jgi:hypothetical protein
MIALDRRSTDPWERRLAALPRWLSLMWVLGLGGLAAIRNPSASGPTWAQKLWALAWAWVLFGGFFLIVAWLAVALLWWITRLFLLALAAALTVAWVLIRFGHRSG